MTNPIAIGIDGGASSLKWSIRDADGQFHHGSAPGANMQLMTWTDYTLRLGIAIVEALTVANVGLSQVQSLGLGLAGVDRKAEKRKLTRWAKDKFPNLQGLWIGNDALPALRQGAGRLEGIILIAGTGSICYGALEDGRTIRVGGWGSVLGDEGSGYWIGYSAIRAACRMADGREDTTPLLQEVLEGLKLAQPMELIPWTAAQRPHKFKSVVAGLAPIVFRRAAFGDHSARRIVNEAECQLVEHVLAARDRLDELESNPSVQSGMGSILRVVPEGADRPERTVVFAGGLMSQNPEFYSSTALRLIRCAKGINCVRLTEPASLGSLALGLEAK